MEPREEKESVFLPSGVEVAMGAGGHHAPSSWAQRKTSERKMPGWRWWKWRRWTMPIRQEFSILQTYSTHDNTAAYVSLVNLILFFF